jgi:hypothetical protein
MLVLLGVGLGLAIGCSCGSCSQSDSQPSAVEATGAEGECGPECGKCCEEVAGAKEAGDCEKCPLCSPKEGAKSGEAPAGKSESKERK